MHYSLTSPSQKKKHQKVFEKYPKVITFITPALFSMQILSLHKLLDENADHPVSVYRCISMARQLSLISADQKKFLKKRINGAKPIWRKVDVLRNQLIAHRDYSISISKVFATANVSPKELRYLALSHCKVLNELVRAIGEKPFDPEDYCDRLFTESDGFLGDLLKAI